MIIDSLQNSTSYDALHPRMRQAFEFLLSPNLQALAPGRYAIDGDAVYAEVAERELIPAGNARLEAHDAYIDIQVPLSGAETFGWSPREELLQQQAPFDSQRDICFYDDAPRLFFGLRPGDFVVFMPSDAHAPLVGEGGCVRKVVVKVRIK